MAKKATSDSAVAPFLQNIEKLSKPQRLGIYIGTLIVIVGLSGYLLFWPKYKQIDRLKTELSNVQAELDKTKKAVEKLNYWRSQMNQKELEYKTVMRALPEKEEIPTLLAGISQAGKDAGLEFLLFKPKKESNKTFYAEIPVDINVSGSYHQVAVFFDKVSNLSRIVNIRDIKMAPTKSGSTTLTTSCQAVTYKFLEESRRTGAQTRRPQQPGAK